MARSPADGYTVLYGGLTPLVAYAAAGGTVPYDPAKAFTPVGLGSLGYPAFVVNSALGIKMLMAPYKGPVMVDLIAGHIQTSLGFSAELEPHVASGKLTVLASFAPKRLPKFPNTPTFAEAGFPNMEMPGWNAFFMPAGAPKEAVDRFNAEVIKAMTTRPEMVEWRTSVGGVCEAWTAEQFADFVRAEHIKWCRMSDDLGIKVTP